MAGVPVNLTSERLSNAKALKYLSFSITEFRKIDLEKLVMKRYMRYIIKALVLLIVCNSHLAIAASGAPGVSAEESRVFPIKSHPYGKSYGVWGQEFAQWLFNFGPFDYPLFQPDGEVDCSKNQIGPVWFLYGVGGGSVERSCTIPAGKAVFFNPFSAFSWAPDYGNTEEEVRQDAAGDVASVQNMGVIIDGILVNDPFVYRGTSPEGGFVLTIEEGTILDFYEVIEAGDYYPAISDGYYIMLKPLSVGEHTIHWFAEGVQPVWGPYSWNVTWQLTVVDDKE